MQSLVPANFNGLESVAEMLPPRLLFLAALTSSIGMAGLFVLRFSPTLAVAGTITIIAAAAIHDMAQSPTPIKTKTNQNRSDSTRSAPKRTSRR